MNIIQKSTDPFLQSLFPKEEPAPKTTPVPVKAVTPVKATSPTPYKQANLAVPIKGTNPATKVATPASGTPKKATIGSQFRVQLLLTILIVSRIN